MAVDITSVANRALMRLGSPRVTSLEEDSLAATELREQWDNLRQAELRAHPWKFARRRMKIPAAAAAPAWGYDRQFPLPPNCCRVLQVGEDYRFQPAYEIEGGYILTSAPAPLPLIFVVDEVQVGRWDGAFAEVFSARVAYELCERITGNAGKRQLLWRDYQETLKVAKKAGALEVQTRELIGSEPWIEAHDRG